MKNLHLIAKQKVICTNNICQGECGSCNFMTLVNVEEPKQEKERGITITHVGKQEPNPFELPKALPDDVFFKSLEEPKQEIWKDIPNYEGLYQVSNFGNVKSLSRTITKGNITYVTKDKNLKQSIDSRGYLYVNLSDYNKQKTFRVHQLIAVAFFNHVPDKHKGFVIDHIDNNKLNNNLSNLQLLSSRENTSKDRKNKTSKYTGVYWNKECKKFASQIRIDKKVKHLGLFDNEDDAYIAYQNALQEQNKNKYSEEDLRNCFTPSYQDFGEWFEQFKNK